jgi:hypothetical protein
MLSRSELAGFLLVHVEDFDIDFHVGIEVEAEVAVDELEAVVGELVGEDAAGEADFLIDGFQGGFLGVEVGAEIPFVGEEIAGADATVGEDAVAGHGGAPGWVKLENIANCKMRIAIWKTALSE